MIHDRLNYGMLWLTPLPLKLEVKSFCLCLCVIFCHFWLPHYLNYASPSLFVSWGGTESTRARVNFFIACSCSQTTRSLSILFCLGVDSVTIICLHYSILNELNLCPLILRSNVKWEEFLPSWVRSSFNAWEAKNLIGGQKYVVVMTILKHVT